MSHGLRPLISNLEDRIADAVISRSRIVNAPLRQFLRERVSRPAGSPGAFLADPVFEAAFGWKQAQATMHDLATKGDLHPQLVDSLAKAEPVDATERDTRNVFPLDRKPFSHQLAAWQGLSGDKVRSVVVSSGTGSGKTEAFLVPILDSLSRQQQLHGKLVGVQALLIYPLNALIASQQDRLTDWTEPYSGNIRYCLYNGNTPERLRSSDQRTTPWEVRDRKELRSSPPPILVTNATMLEYMLIRAVDAPILAASQGRLKWVVLDEAHTYIGSQAAEMTLLLRRTLHAFGVKPKDVRFVATSATLGNDEDARLRLRRFLADLAGTDEQNVDVIEGQRQVPPVLVDRDDYQGIAREQRALALRNALIDKPSTLTELTSSNPGEATLELLERAASSVSKEGETFLPLRLHLFQRANAGAWACLNPKCSGRKDTSLESPLWAYGKVFERDTPLCDACGSPTHDVLLCEDCGTVFLDVATDVTWQRVGRWREERALDEFLAEADEAEDEEQDETDVGSQGARHLLAPPSIEGGTYVSIDRLSGEIRDRASDSTVQWGLFERSRCPCCGAGAAKRRLFRSLRLGGPFMVATAANVLLDHAPKRRGVTKEMPFGGRQLITFTDNRQGTARFAAKWQQDSERNYFRSVIYHALHAADVSTGENVQQKRTQLQALEPHAANNPTIATMVETLRSELQSLDRKGVVRSWAELRTELSAANRDQRQLLDLWADRDPRFAGADELATLQLFTEFLRRPVRTNSLETMGMAAIQFPAIERLREADVPPLFTQCSATIGDWKDYLHLVVTFFLRANSVVHIDDGLRWWIGQRVAPKSAHHPDHEGAAAPAHISWPRLVGAGGRGSRPVLLLRDGLGLDFNDREMRERVNDTLRRAYACLSPLRVGGATDFKIDLTKAEFARVKDAWLCPVTRRLLDRTFRGLTPFLSQIPSSRPSKCEKVSMPSVPAPWLRTARGDDAREGSTVWLKDDEAVKSLRKDGIWTDLHDRLVMMNPFVRVAEHSAQQPPSRLRSFEKDFKLGHLNVLCCSTTMEMGVDIGGISTVLMTNVPPSPANYRQRVGRAGRRGEALSIALAYCSDSPLGWATFDMPKGPLIARIAPPRVALESRPIVQRHVNAFLLGQFLRSQAVAGSSSGATLESAWFFVSDNAADTPRMRFLALLRSPGSQRQELEDGIAGIVSRTALQDHGSLLDECADALGIISVTWLAEHQALKDDLEASVDSSAKKALELQLKRFSGEFLLSFLSHAGFLPGHGFPTDVVPLVVHSPAELREGGAFGNARDDTPVRSRGYPTRQLEQALREYAPGSDIVLDGLVYRSAGLTLNWKRPAGTSDASEIQSLTWFWRCASCQSIGTSHGMPEICSSCGSDRLRSEHVLRPGGFAVDIAEKPTNDVDHVSYIPPSRPALGMAGVPWLPLENPELGRCRASAEGRILALSRGATAGGYAVCLLCGRAAPESGAPQAGTEAPLPQAMQDHRSLRRSKTRRALRCEAAERPFAIQRNISLGYSRRTDMFELQLEGLRGETAATTIALAVREGFVLQLGIERDEVGWSVQETPDDRGGALFSIYLYDVAAGGAGYASTAGSDVVALLRDALKALNCRNAGCVSGCPACLIVRDSATIADKIDRQAAIAFLTPFLEGLVLPASEQVFGPAVPQRASTIPLPRFLEQAMAAGADHELWLFLPSDIRDWNFGAWWPASLIERLGHQGRVVRLVVPPGLDRQITFDLGLSMQALLNRSGPRVGYWPIMRPITPSGLVAAIATGTSMKAWAHLSRIPSPRMEVNAPETLIQADDVGLPELGSQISIAGHLRQLTASVMRLEVGQELDGSALDFGRRLWSALLGVNPLARSAFRSDQIIEYMIYTDRYLFSPLACQLLCQTIRSVPGTKRQAPPPSLRIITQGDRRDARPGLPDQLHHDWSSGTLRKAVLTAALQGSGFAADIQFKDLRDLPHRRSLQIGFEDGGCVEILFDQGMGYWRVRGRSPFDFNANVTRQAGALVGSSAYIVGDRHHKTTILVDVSRLAPRSR
jgi:hypothetical protein